MTDFYNLGNSGNSASMMAPSPYLLNYGLNTPQQGGSQLLPQLGGYGSAQVPTSQVGATTPTAPGGGIMDFLFGQNTKEAPGAFGSIVGGASALSSAMLGWGQYNMAKDTLATNKQQFQMQYDAQKKMTNSNLEDRQRARVASNAGAYQSVGDYMSKNGVA